MSFVQSEHILVVPTSEFREIGYFQGFTTETQRYLSRLLDPSLVSYRPREEMEQDPSYKQLIPYVIFRHTDSDGKQWVFRYTRGAGQGESRLHQKCSIGVGGHISLEDTRAPGSPNPYHEGLRRELDEEVAIETPFTDRCVGLINDDETEVGRVHLGIVHIYDVDEPLVRPREAEIHDAGFDDLNHLHHLRAQMESWSQICLDHLLV